MSKAPKTVFVCEQCGSESPKWLGRCPDCGEWNSFAEERAQENGGAPPSSHRYALAGAGGAATLYADVRVEQHARLTTGIDEFDRVLGGGIVPGSLVLLGGEPGIGKSTLLLQAAANIARSVGPVLYSSGEESEHQIKSRGERLSVGQSPLYLLAETCLERILEEIARIKPALVIVDSVQTVFSLKFQSAPGSIGQVREAATQLLFTAKGQNIPTFLVGHVTKDGSLAGPKALEHVVDTVLYFEGERHHSHRVERSEPRDSAHHGNVRRSRPGRRSAGHGAGGAARARSRADGVPPLHHARREHRSRRSWPVWRRLRARGRPHHRGRARRASPM